MLVREVFGWLRYCLQKDPVCVASGILCDEIGSPLLSLMDVTDGPRTLAIYKSDKGYVPRIEIRFTGEFPQVWWIGESPMGGESATYLISPFSSRFPGGFRSWTRTQFVAFLVDLARSKFANDTLSFLNLIPTTAEVVAAAAKLDFNSFMRLVNTAHNAKSKNTKTSKAKIEEFVKNNAKSSYDVGIDIAKDAEYYLSTKSNDFKFFQLVELVEWLEKAGIKIGPILCKDFQDPKLWKHLPPDWEENEAFCTLTQKKQYFEETASVETKIKEILDSANEGENLESAVKEDHNGQFGETMHTALSSAGIPLHYLPLVEKADYREALAPWSMIRRSVIAYEIPKENDAALEDAVVAWLNHAQLITALYKTNDETMQDLLRNKVKAFTARTVGNHAWVWNVCEDVTAAGELDRAKALQSEFDMWLLQALSPAMAGCHLPLSPYAFNTGRKDEGHYNKVFGSWLKAFKNSAQERRAHSIQSLAQALDHFYRDVIAAWDKESVLEGYEPRIPLVKSILASAVKGDRGGLFKVLAADLEDEVGSKVPYEIKAQILKGPSFNTVYREIRFQNFKL